MLVVVSQENYKRKKSASIVISFCAICDHIFDELNEKRQLLGHIYHVREETVSETHISFDLSKITTKKKSTRNKKKR